LHNRKRPIQFRDPIHGFIAVSPLELKIIDSPPFQRLRNIKQLATTYLVYPGAEHTRFGHSLGTMHLVTRAFESALQNYAVRNGEELFGSSVKAWYTQILRLIALTHDLGHAPFSHASELLFEGGLEHEDFTKKIISETVVGDYIREIGQEFREEYGEQYDITPELLWMIYGEKKPELNSDYKMPDYKFLKSFMDSELDCDKMDYLLRDSYYCGVNYGRFDLERLIGTLNVYVSLQDNVMLLSIEHGGVSAFEEFVLARYFMFRQVYFHKTRRYLDLLLVDCLERILPKNKYPSDVEAYLQLNDSVIYDQVKVASEGGDVSVCDFLERKVMTCVYETAPHHMSNSENALYSSVKKDIKRAGIKSKRDSAEKLAHKIPILDLYNHDSGKGIPVLLDNRERPSNLLEESPILRGLENPINLKRIYVRKEDAEKAKAIVNEVFREDDDDE